MGAEPHELDRLAAPPAWQQPPVPVPHPPAGGTPEWRRSKVFFLRTPFSGRRERRTKRARAPTWRLATQRQKAGPGRASLRAATELDPAATGVSLDGRCAYDSVSRAAFLDKLAEVTPSLVPFVRAFYARQSVYLWWDGAGACHRILQGDGCEQGDALAPALFALAQHVALVATSQQLRPGEFLAAFLDDLYIVTVPNRARAALEAVSSAVEELAGVAANLGKARVGISELGPEAWRGDKPLPERGFVALGTPIGAPEYVAACARERLEQEQGLLAELPQLPDLQCAWLRLLVCAAPRAQHLLRTVPPYCKRSSASADARRLAFLPAREGGLGLLCATHAAPAANWAAWADSLPVMLQRRPDAPERCVRELLVDDEAAAPCLREAAVAGDLLRRHWPGTTLPPGAHARRLAQAPAPRAAPRAPVLRRRWVPGVRRRARCLGRPCGSVPAQRTVGPPRPLA